MIALSGLEKFSHLEDKIYRTIELTKTLRQEKESADEVPVYHRVQKLLDLLLRLNKVALKIGGVSRV